MNRALQLIQGVLPHRVAASMILRRRFMNFAHMNGLVYFGTMLTSDEYDPVRGFTASPDQLDAHVSTGTVHGRDVTVLQRTVSHDRLPGRPTGRIRHSWILVSIKHDVSHAPSLLLLSHKHPRLHDEAVAIQSAKSRHVAVHSDLDARYLIYGSPVAAEDFKANITNAVIATLTAHPEYDYEFDAESVYVYAHVQNPTETDLTRLLTTALSLVDAYEKSPV